MSGVGEVKLVEKHLNESPIREAIRNLPWDVVEVRSVTTFIHTQNYTSRKGQQ